MNQLSQQLIQVNHYDLVSPSEAYHAAAQALVERAKREGHLGLLDYRFFANPVAQTAGIIITYADADAWLAHHKLIYQWDEIGALQATVKMRHFDLFGPLNDGVKAFIADAEAKSNLVFSLYGDYASGFIR